MGHVRKDTLTRGTGEWAKHLRPFGKRQTARKERQAAVRFIVAGSPNKEGDRFPGE